MSLTEAEKQDLARRIPRGIQVISSSLAQLHLSSPDPSVNPYADETGIVASLRSFGEKRWKFTNIEGALLLTRDKDGIHHFRIYDLAEYKLRFQYELYENLEYVRLADTFHAFEMEKCVGGFNFSSKDVADKFYERVQRNIIHNGNVIYSVPQPASFTSPGFMAPVMQAQMATFSNQETGSKNGVGLGGSENKKSRAKGKKRKTPQTGSTPATQPPKPAASEVSSNTGGAIFLANGLVDPKFYKRVQRNIIRNGDVIYAGPPPAWFPPPGLVTTKNLSQIAALPDQQTAGTNDLTPGDSENEENIAKGNRRLATSTGATPTTQPPNPPASGVSSSTRGALFLPNGLVDAKNVPPEWKKIFKKAGIRKKDLLNPQMQDVIGETLEEHNIFFDPPPLDMDDAEIRKYYSPDQLAEYEEYKEEMASYEQAREQYLAEMAEFERKQMKLEQLLKQQEVPVPVVDHLTEERRKQEEQTKLENEYSL